jgi:hypothetical protein
VIARARGNRAETSGERGVDKREARIEPIVVSNVMCRVAGKGERIDPAMTLTTTLPGMLHACFQMAVMDRTAITWRRPWGELSAYDLSSWPSCAMSFRVFGKDRKAVIGRDVRAAATGKSERTKRKRRRRMGA